MQTPPLVSVLIPCFNSQEFVAEAIESALGQTHPRIEVVVVDDGSTDGSVELLRSFGDRIIFEAAPNRGACSARNRALQLSSGRYIQFLDADDRLCPTKIEQQLPLLESDEADLVFCNGFLFGDGRPMRRKKSRILDPTGVDPFVYCLRQGLSTEGPLHRRECLERVGGFREHLRRAQEYDLHVRLGATGVRIHFMNEFLCEHRNHDGPRITRTPQPPDHMVNLLLGLADIVESGPPYEMTRERREALAATLSLHSFDSFCKDSKEGAARGFKRVKKLSPRFDYIERVPLRALARLLGPLAAEQLVRKSRAVRAFLGRVSQRTSP